MVVAVISIPGAAIPPPAAGLAFAFVVAVFTGLGCVPHATAAKAITVLTRKGCTPLQLTRIPNRIDDHLHLHGKWKFLRKPYDLGKIKYLLARGLCE
jgi:hypothetical protein